MNIAAARLSNQRLVGEKFEKAQEVVNWLGAIQAQDFPMAKWGLGLRLKDATDEIVEKAYNDGRILRTHIMRPTWHFVPPQDLVWMQELTSGRVKTFMGHYNRKLELDDKLFAKSSSTIVKALRNENFLTRKELKEVLADVGIKGDVQRYAHIISWAELDSLICSGPKKGKQLTYALVEERVTKSKNLNKDEALGTLALKYFTSHGPAQVKDFSWWSGLTMKDANEGLSMNKSKLEEKIVNGKSYWFSPKNISLKLPSNTAFLLSIYDEYTIAYKDRSDVSDYRDIEKMIMMGNALTAVLIIDGKAVGTWKRKIKKNSVEIKTNLFRKINADEKEAIKKAVDELGKFLGLKTILD